MDEDLRICGTCRWKFSRGSGNFQRQRFQPQIAIYGITRARPPINAPERGTHHSASGTADGTIRKTCRPINNLCALVFGCRRHRLVFVTVHVRTRVSANVLQAQVPASDRRAEGGGARFAGLQMPDDPSRPAREMRADTVAADQQHLLGCVYVTHGALGVVQ